jgi:hypothetical protein
MTLTQEIADLKWAIKKLEQDVEELQAKAAKTKVEHHYYYHYSWQPHYLPYPYYPNITTPWFNTTGSNISTSGYVNTGVTTLQAASSGTLSTFTVQGNE